MLQTLTEYLRERVRSLKSEYPDEPVGRSLACATGAECEA